MGFYDRSIGTLKRDLSEKEKLHALRIAKKESVLEKQREAEDLLSVRKVISTIADENSLKTLDFISGVINKTLGQLFKYDSRRIRIEKYMHGGKHAHLKVELQDSSGNNLDFVLQAGTGLRQVVSFLFSLCLIKVSGGRRLFIQDELLSGVHGAARQVLKKIIEIFAEDDELPFQFIMVEYGIDDLGKMYSVEKRGKFADVYALENGYDPDAIFQNTDVFVSAESNVYLHTEDED